MPCILPPDSTDSSINHQKHYLATEFLRYFPDAHEIIVQHRDDGETIWVSVVGFDGFNAVTTDFTFECGSDDDWYIFTIGEAICDVTAIITIPLETQS
jgi:hypothetical protein